MSGIARLLLQKGFVVSGSDVKESANTKELRQRGAQVLIGHAAQNVVGAAEVVVSSAIRPENVELLEAKRLSIPVCHRACKLAQLVNEHRGITIAGTHGKTTTSSMIATLLCSAGLLPSYVVGGIINTMADNARAGQSEWIVIEADESDGSLVEFRPEIAVVTNIELDHTDYYHDAEQLYGVFQSYLLNTKPEGLCVYCADDPGVSKLMARCPCLEGKSISYALENPADLTVGEVTYEELGSRFDVYRRGERLGAVELRIPGRHNVQNSLAAVAVGLHIGLSFDEIAQGVASFRGVQRRFQVIGRSDKVTVVDDYAHHPSEIRATLLAARCSHSARILSIFQPHRYSRTQSLAKEFGAAFGNADEVVVTDIYPAGEDPIPNVSSELIVESLRENQHPSVHFVRGLDRVEEFVASLVQPQDLVITLGAGDIWKVAESLSRRLIA